MNFIPNESPSKMGFMSVIRVIIASEIIVMSWIICQNAVILYDFHSSSTYFHKNSSRFVISIKNWIYRHLICTFLTKKNFSKKSWLYPENIQNKKFQSIFWTEISRFIYQSMQFLTKITNLILFLLKNVIKKQKLQDYAQTGSYLAIFPFLLHFSTKIISNS